MNSIKLLDDITIQQIAAGEIIDRPASIVKEVIENSMDANSNTITLEIKNGGKSYIRVTDNGDGIHTDDIGLAFQRHSTSKLNRAEDLYNIHSFGFRGEALASISAVSKIELLTKTRETKGSQVYIRDGEVIEKLPVGCPNGTTLIMKDIFYNFPVRKNFLKSDLVEGNRITDTITRLAIGNPNISFKYIKDSKVVFKTPGKGELLQTIFSILGREFNENLIDLEYRSEDLNIFGFISKNSFYRSNRAHQYLYVNNRFINNSNINNIIEAQYKSLIPVNRYPIYFLFIDIDSKKVDVNIHPTKQEVNFADQNNLNEILQKTIDSTLKKSLEIQSIPKRVKAEKKDNIPLLYESTFFEKEDKNNKIKESEKIDGINLLKDKDNKNYKKDYNVTSLMNKEKGKYDLDKIKEYHKEKKELLKSEEDILLKDKQESKINNDLKNDKVISKREEFENIMKNMRILGIVFKTYILGEDNIDRNLILIDQHAAHERIMYENYLNKYRDSSISTQLLLQSEVIELSDIELNLFNTNKEFFNSIGFSVDEFGLNSIVVRGVPMIFGEPEPRQIFFEVLDNLDKNIDSPYEIKLEKIMKIACTSAVKSGDNLIGIEVEELIKSLLETDVPFTCPHGRPTVIKLNERDLEKYFKRIM